MKRALIVILTTVLTVLGIAGVASADPPNIDQCKSGGYASYVDPATSSPFVNQGRCISVVARGGVLVPVAPPASVGTWAITADGVGHCNASTTLTGAASTAFPLTWLADGADDGVQDVTTDSGGTVAIDHTFVKGVTAQLVVDDQTFDLPTIDCTLPIVVTPNVGINAGVFPPCKPYFHVTGEPSTGHSYVLTYVDPNFGSGSTSGFFTLNTAGYQDVVALSVQLSYGTSISSSVDGTPTGGWTLTC